MSVIGDILVDFVGELLGYAFWRAFHASGRRLIFLMSLGWIRIPSLRNGGGGGGADFGAFAAGLVFWLAVAAGALWLAFR